MAIVFHYLYHPRFGILNRALGALGICRSRTGSAIRSWAMPAIILLAVWKDFGYTMIIFIAGLQNIPEELYEAARHRRRGALAAVPPRHAADARADVPLRRHRHRHRRSCRSSPSRT